MFKQNRKSQNFNSYNFIRYQQDIARNKRLERIWWIAAMVLFALLITLSLAGCGGNDSNQTEPDSCKKQAQELHDIGFVGPFECKSEQ